MTAVKAKLWQDIQEFCKQIHIKAVGVAPYPAPISALRHISPDDVCPFTAGTGEERLYGVDPEIPYLSAIVALFPYALASTDTKENIARYTRGDDYHIVIRKYMEKIGEFLSTHDANCQWEVAVDTSPLADRYMAYLAGLGFFGKNHCFIHPQFGSYTAIGLLLTTEALPVGTPLQQSCAQCNRCIEACPGNALRGKRLDYEKCKSYLTQKKGQLTAEEEAILSKTDFIFGCDRCQEVCPHNFHIPDTPFPEFQEQMSYVDVQELQEMTNRQFKEKYGHKAFAWRGKAILIRNDEIIQKK